MSLRRLSSLVLLMLLFYGVSYAAAVAVPGPPGPTGPTGPTGAPGSGGSGITKTLTIKDSGGGSCTITVVGGSVTASTCTGS